MCFPVSVVMSVYNGEQYLKYAIDSILNQVFKDFEFIIVNDSSTDETETIIKSYKDSRIIYLKNEKNNGQTESLNRGIRISKGVYVARMDQDDISLPERLSTQVEFMEQNHNVAVVGTWHQEIDSKNRLIRKCRFPTKPSVKVRLLFSRLVGWACISHPTVMVRAKMLSDIGYYDPRYHNCQDHDLWIRVSRRYLIENIPQILLSYRIHPLSSGLRRSDITVKEMEDIVLSNIDFHLPDAHPDDKAILFRMLTSKRQAHARDGERIFGIFNDFYAKVMSAELADGATKKAYESWREKLKIFYLPQLFKTNRARASKYLAKFSLTFPEVILSRRFYGALKNAIGYGKKNIVRKVKIF